MSWLSITPGENPALFISKFLTIAKQKDKDDHSALNCNRCSFATYVNIHPYVEV